jgi:hypothetical protein
MHDFRRLAVWQPAREFALAIDIRTRGASLAQITVS